MEKQTPSTVPTSTPPQHAPQPHPPVGLAVSTRLTAASAAKARPAPPPSAGDSSPVLPASPDTFNPHIMHAPISPALTSQTVLLSASTATLALVFGLPEALIASHWITSATPRSTLPVPVPELSSPSTSSPSPSPSAAANTTLPQAVAPSQRVNSSHASTRTRGHPVQRHVPYLLSATTTTTSSRPPQPQQPQQPQHQPFSPPPGADPAALRRRLALLAAARNHASTTTGLAPPTTCCCGWTSAASTDIVVASSVVGRRGRAVYRGTSFNAAIPLAQFNAKTENQSQSQSQNQKSKSSAPPSSSSPVPWARYTEAHILVGGGVCIGVGDTRTLRHDRLVGAVASSVGFHDSGKLVCGTAEWTSYCAPFRSGDTVGVLICGTQKQAQTKPRTPRSPRATSAAVAPAELPPTSPAASSPPSSSSTSSIASFSPTSNNNPHSDLAAVAIADATAPPHRVTVSFSVNGVFGPPVPLDVPAAATAIAVATSLYSNDARVRAACCEASWRKFPAAARLARPAPVTGLCAAAAAAAATAAGSEGEPVDERDVRVKSRPIVVVEERLAPKKLYHDVQKNEFETSPLRTVSL